MVSVHFVYMSRVWIQCLRALSFVTLGSVITFLELPGDSLVLDTCWQAEEARVMGLMENGGSSDGHPCLSPGLFLSVERCYSIQGHTGRHIQRCVS